MGLGRVYGRESGLVRSEGEMGTGKVPLKRGGEGVSGVERSRRRRGEWMVGGMAVGLLGGLWWKLVNNCTSMRECKVIGLRQLMATFILTMLS